MANSEERDTVTKIVHYLESQLNGDIFLRDPGNRIGRIKVQRMGFGSERGSPDVVAWLDLQLEVLNVPVRMRVPILIEAEKAGLDAAKEDYRKFFKREKLEIPMVVVGRSGARMSLPKTQQAEAKVEVTMRLTTLDRVKSE